MESLAKLLQKCWDNPERYHIKDGAKAKATATAEHKVGRSIVGCWMQAIPMDQWAVHYPDVGAPEKTGYEIIGGRRQQVAYVPKFLTGYARPDHYDVMEYDENSVVDNRALAEVHSDGDTEDEDAYAAKARKAKAMVFERQSQALSNAMCVPVFLSHDICPCYVFFHGYPVRELVWRAAIIITEGFQAVVACLLS